MLYRVLASVWIALRMVQRNKLRAGLTVIGITIGIAAVVTMIALGKGARTSVSASVSSLGSNMLIVFPHSGRSSGAKSKADGSRLSESDCEALVRDSTSIRLAAPFMRASAQAVYEGQNTKTSVIGSRLSYFEVRNLKVVKGEQWTASAEAIGEKVVLIGATTARDLFGSTDPLGRSIRIGKYLYRVIGLLEEKGNSPFGEDQDQIVLMPITTLRSHVLPSTRPGDVQGIMLSATSEATTGRALKQATEILRQRHRIAEGDEDDFDVRTQAELQSLQEGIFGALSALLVAIAGISLLVGGIGVMNIMLVSVTERTREIGIRMAIGAREADILIQFLVEAIALAVAGGLVGTLFGYGAILGLSAALGWSMTLDTGSLVLALGVSSVIGIVFGFFPARRAAKLDPVTALARE
ncbi:MAG: ABC transporter permease [Byssovorax sp.]